MSKELLRLDNLRTYFDLKAGQLKAIDGVSFQINKGEIMGLIGESGSGKSVTALSIMRLVPFPGKILGDHIYFKGDDLLKKTDREMINIRGSKISMSFQDPMTFLNPIMTIGDQISEAIILNQKVDKKTARKKAIEVMDMMKIPMASKRIDDYPHQFSGGMRQRALLAIAMSCDPELLIADEPTTALDIITQAEILQLLRDLNKNQGTTIMLISHNLGIISNIADKVAIMYSGIIMEVGDVITTFKKSINPYTIELLKTVPTVGQEKLTTIKGEIPNPINKPPGCPFHPRCPYAEIICQTQLPQLIEIDKGHLSSCLLTDKI